MFITITDIVFKKRIDLAYQIQGKEVNVLGMFSDNIQYEIKEPLNLLLITNEEKFVPKGRPMGSELSVFVGRRVITIQLDTNEKVVKMDKLVSVTNLDELDNTDNLENRRLSSVLLKYYVTDSKEFTNFEPVTSQCKICEFNSLTLKITDQKGNKHYD